MVESSRRLSGAGGVTLMMGVGALVAFACGDAVSGNARRGVNVSNSIPAAGSGGLLNGSMGGAAPSGGMGGSPGLGGMMVVSLSGGSAGASMGAGGMGGTGGDLTVSGGMGGQLASMGGAGGAPITGGAAGAPVALAGGMAGYMPFDFSGVNTGERGCGSSGCEGTVVPGVAGSVYRQYWLNIKAEVDEISAFTAFTNAAFPNAPTGADQLTKLQAVDWSGSGKTEYWASYFGERIRGFIKPLVTGDYIFWLAGDNECQFWLSTDQNPKNARPVAWVRQYSPINGFVDQEQRSAPILLEAGKLYYLDLFHRERLGNTHVAVHWSKPGDPTHLPSEIVPGSALVSAVPQ